MSTDSATVTVPTIRIAALGQDVVEVPWEEGLTLSTALERADITPAKGVQFRVNNAATEPTNVLEPGDTVVVVGQIRGGAA